MYIDTNALLHLFSLLFRGQQEPKVQLERQVLWDHKAIQGDLAQKDYEASQALQSVDNVIMY